VSLGVAALGVGRLLSPAFDGWIEGRDLALGAIVVGVVALSYGVARASASRPLVTRGPA
jgi:high-affinity nickel-transport protein